MTENPHMIPIRDLEFSIRTENALRNAGLMTLGAVASKSEKELMLIPNMGRRSVTEVKALLGAFDMALREGPLLTPIQQMEHAVARAKSAKMAYENAIADIQRLVKLTIDMPIPEMGIEP